MIKTETLKLLIGSSFFFVTLIVVSILRFKDKITSKQFTTVVMGMLSVMAVLLGAVINWKTLKVELAGGGQSGASHAAYGLKIDKVVWKHYYQANGDFSGEIEYHVMNNSGLGIVDLPPDRAGWFGWDVNPEFNYNVYGQDSSFYSVEKQFLTKDRITRTEHNGTQKNVTMLNWQLGVKPSLEPGKSLHYGVTVKTRNTEAAAFSNDGSYAGMATLFPADALLCEINAPENYRFIYKDFRVRDHLGNTLPYEGKKPEVSGDGRKIEWEVSNPIPTARYLVGLSIIRTP